MEEDVRTVGELIVSQKSPATVGDCLMRFKVSSLPWPLPEELDDDELEERLYPLRQASFESFLKLIRGVD